MSTERRLIINADDFGLSAGVNRGIIRAHEDGVLTSASLMVRGAAVGAAADYARGHPRLSVGLHLDLGEWAYGAEGWLPVYQVVDVTDLHAVGAEVNRQLAGFREWMGRDPTHLDSHQHVHLTEPILGLMRREACGMGIVLRRVGHEVRYCGDFYGQSNRGDPCHGYIGVEALIRNIAGLPVGVTEMGCHPGEDGDVDSVYRDERAIEVRTLCDPRVRTAITDAGVLLCSFAGWRGDP